MSKTRVALSWLPPRLEGVRSQHSLHDLIKFYGNVKKLFRSQPVIATERTGAAVILTDLFYYKKKTWESSSLITALTSDNFTPLLSNGNITHTIWEMGKQFRVLFKPRPRQSPLRREEMPKSGENQERGSLMPLSPVPQRGGRKDKTQEQLPWGARGGRSASKSSTFAQRGCSAAGNGLRWPVTMVGGNGMACRGIKQRTNESKQNKWEGWNPACRITIVPHPSRQISASESATSQEYEAKQSFNGARRP